MVEHFGDMTHENGYVVTTMTRELMDVTVKDVWRMLSQESERIKWLAPGTIDLFAGGRAKLDFKDSYVEVDSAVTRCEINKVLEFSWSSGQDPMRPICFEIAGQEDGSCKLTLTVSIPDTEVVARSCAGWEAHLTMLQAALAGVPCKFPLDRFKASREYFDTQLAQIMMSEVPVLRL
jgi:uncharacterized protein YndB with AHSA1/START domain